MILFFVGFMHRWWKAALGIDIRVRVRMGLGKEAAPRVTWREECRRGVIGRGS